MRYILCIILLFIFTGCVNFHPAQIHNIGDIKSYKYAYVVDTQQVISVIAGGSYGSTMGVGSVYGYSKSINPKDLIIGKLMSLGLLIVNEIKDESNTVIVQYANVGRRNIMGGLGYTMIVKIQIIDALTHNPVYICEAEGIGDTEVEDITIAIDRCLTVLISDQ